jgi:hypothetical protein
LPKPFNLAGDRFFGHVCIDEGRLDGDMPQLLLHGPQVLFFAIKLHSIRMPKGMGGFAFFIEVQGFQVFLDELLDGLGCPFASLP